MKHKNKIANWCASVLLVAAVVICITVIAQVLSTGYVTIFGRSLFRVVTGSMEPTISTGALLVSKEVDIEEIELGDIICFRSKETNMLGQVITHRVVEIVQGQNGETYLETRGDANPSSDGYYVTADNFIGKVVTYSKEGNLLASIYGFVTTPVGFMTCVVFPVLIIAGFIMQESVNSIRKEMHTISQQVNEVSEKTYLSEEEYEDMVKRLKQEILEEVKGSVDQTKESESSGE